MAWSLLCVCVCFFFLDMLFAYYAFVNHYFVSTRDYRWVKLVPNP